jgi:hypothetical protein
MEKSEGFPRSLEASKPWQRDKVQLAYDELKLARERAVVQEKAESCRAAGAV